MSKIFSFRLQYARAQIISKVMKENPLKITPSEYSFHQTVNSDWTKMKRLAAIWIPLVG
jgi:hypothetical protein